MLDPPRHFSYRWQLPDLLLTMIATYILEEENGGTRVLFTETGYQSLSEDVRQQRIEQNSKSWQMALENLKAYLESRSLPYPEGL